MKAQAIPKKMIVRREEKIICGVSSKNNCTTK